MKLLILRGFCLGHGIDVFPGDTVELDEVKARYLVDSGKARLAPDDVDFSEKEAAEKEAARKGAKNARN